jgi:hypothetical protein
MTREGVASALAALLLLSGLTACGASPTPLGPTGIDELTVPTPTPEPADFSADVDNPWFPLAPGTTWTYQRYTVDGSERLRATALDQTRSIDGVDTRPVRWDALCRTGPTCRGGTTPLGVRWYAQDAAGNVWWFGQRLTAAGDTLDPLATRSWVAGHDGAEAGLVMAAAPRAGDGYANALQPGVVERRSTVVSLDATATLPDRSYRHTVLTQDVSGLDPVVIVRSYFARGTGLVAQGAEAGSSTQLFLLSVHR